MMAQVAQSETAAKEKEKNTLERVSFSELVTSLFVLGLLVFCGLAVSAVAVGGLFGVPGRDVWRFLVRWWMWLSLSVSAAAVVGVGVWRCLRYERSEKLSRLEVSRRWMFEDEERDRLNGVGERQAGARVGQAELDAAAVVYLRRYYAAGELSRDVWMKHGLSKDVWDQVNTLMVKRGIRHGRRSELVPATFADAWLTWCDGKLKSRSWSVKDDGDLLEQV